MKKKKRDREGIPKLHKLRQSQYTLYVDTFNQDPKCTALCSDTLDAIHGHPDLISGEISEG